MTLCPHIKQVNKNTVEKSITNTRGNCSYNHQTISPLLCLICTQSILCNQISESQNCVIKHSTEHSHPLYLVLETGFIICKQCTNDFEQMMNNYKGEDQQQLKKTRIFYNFIRKCWLSRKQQEMELSKQDKIICFGLVNLGNTCFFNSVIQAIYRDEYANIVRDLNFQSKIKFNPFKKQVQFYFDQLLEKDQGEWIVVNKKKSQSNKLHKPINDNSINKQFRKLLMNAAWQQIYNPSDLFESVSRIYPLFKQYKQQDAQQFLRIFFDALKEGQLKSLDLNFDRYKKIEQIIGVRKLTIIDKYYGCYLASKLVCIPCSNTSWTLDLALDFTVQLSKKQCKIQLQENKTIKKTQLNYHQDLQYPTNLEVPDILKSFFSYELLSTYKCPKCLLSNSKRKFFIVDPPNTLTIVLKRFKSNMTKDSTFIPFQQTIDISGCSLINRSEQYTNLTYVLSSVVVHLGSSDYYGHYICYRKHDDHWLYFSDEQVRPTTWQKVKNSIAYILIYTRL